MSLLERIRALEPKEQSSYRGNAPRKPKSDFMTLFMQNEGSVFKKHWWID